MEETKQERAKRLQRARYAKWRAAHPTGERDASRKRRATHPWPWPAKRAMGLYVNEYKASTPCAKCGSKFPAECMDFDHRDGEEKTNNVGTMVAHGWNRERILAEIAKCDLVCANCHRTITRLRRLSKNTKVQPGNNSDGKN